MARILSLLHCDRLAALQSLWQAVNFHSAVESSPFYPLCLRRSWPEPVDSVSDLPKLIKPFSTDGTIRSPYGRVGRHRI